MEVEKTIFKICRLSSIQFLEEIYDIEYYIKKKYQKWVTKFSTLEN